MACTIHKVKHMYWYMVLATVVVLTWILNSPKTMGKMIVAGSSASQHEPRDARVKRFLRPSSYMTEKSNGGDEERMGFPSKALAPSESTIRAVKKADFDLNVPALSESMTKALKDLGLDLSFPAQSEGMTEALRTGKQLEVGMPKAGEKANSLIKTPVVVTSFDQMTPKKWLKLGKTGKSLYENLLKDFREEEALNYITVGKNSPSITLRKVARLFEVGFIQKWTEDKREADIFERLWQVGKGDLKTFLGSGEMRIWDALYFAENKAPLTPTLLGKLSERFEESKLPQLLYSVHQDGNEQAKKMAARLIKLQSNYDDLNSIILKNDVSVLDNSQLISWVEQMKKLEKSEHKESKTILSLLREYYTDVELFKWIAAAQTDVGKQRASYLKSALENALKKPAEKEGKAPATTKRQRSGGEASASTKRQRNDDGQ